MNWTKFREFYGLKSPFNFKVAVPFLLSTFVLAGTLLTAAVLFWNRDLRFGTIRFCFLCYIACLLVIAAGLSRASKLSYIILAWCTIELTLAAGSLILAKHGYGTSLCPRDRYAEIMTSWSGAFIYHPLLQSVPRPNWQYKDHVDFGPNEGKARAAGIDVASLQGQERDFFHNSLGLRGKELTANDLAKDLIFVYGGSTTYDVGVTQGETWVEHLQSEFKNKFTVVNFGMPGHSTVEHLIQTAFYQDIIIKKKPVCAVYYVGWNDVLSAHIEHLDNAYADYHLLLEAERRPPLSLAKYSPLLLLANALVVKRFDTVPMYAQIFGKTPVSGPDEHLEAIFIDHIKTIAAINEARGIRTIVIGQILNRNWSEGPNEYEPLVKDGEEIPLMERMKSILKGTAASIGVKYIDPGITNFGGNDFIDDGHFAAPGTRKFAALVSGEIGDYCR